MGRLPCAVFVLTSKFRGVIDIGQYNDADEAMEVLNLNEGIDWEEIRPGLQDPVRH